MAQIDDVVRLIHKIEGEEELRKMEVLLKSEIRTLQDLNTQLASTDQANQVMIGMQARAAESVDRLREGVQKLRDAMAETAAAEKLAAAHEKLAAAQTKAAEAAESEAAAQKAAAAAEAEAAAAMAREAAAAQAAANATYDFADSYEILAIATKPAIAAIGQTAAMNNQLAEALERQTARQEVRWAKMDQGVKQTAKGFGGATYQVQLFGQMLDDLQYVPEQGLRPILNNVMQISPALGIAMMAVDQLIRHWKQLREIAGFPPMAPHLSDIDALKEGVKKLTAEAEHSVAAFHGLIRAQRELSEATRNHEAVEGMKARQTKVREDNGKAVQEFIQRQMGGGGPVADAFIAQYEQAGTLGQFNRKLETARKKIDDTMAEIAQLNARAAAGDTTKDNRGMTPAERSKRLEDYMYRGDLLYQHSGGAAGEAPYTQRVQEEKVIAEKNARAHIEGKIAGATGGNPDDVRYIEGMARQTKAFGPKVAEGVRDAGLAGQMKWLEEDMKKREKFAEEEEKYLKQRTEAGEKLVKAWIKSRAEDVKNYAEGQAAIAKDAEGARKQEEEVRKKELTDRKKKEHDAKEERNRAAKEAADNLKATVEGPAAQSLAAGMAAAAVRVQLRDAALWAGVGKDLVDAVADRLLQEAQEEAQKRRLKAGMAGFADPNAAVAAGFRAVGPGPAPGIGDAVDAGGEGQFLPDEASTFPLHRTARTRYARPDRRKRKGPTSEDRTEGNRRRAEAKAKAIAERNRREKLRRAERGLDGPAFGGGGNARPMSDRQRLAMKKAEDFARARAEQQARTRRENEMRQRGMMGVAGMGANGLGPVVNAVGNGNNLMGKAVVVGDKTLQLVGALTDGQSKMGARLNQQGAAIDRLFQQVTRGEVQRHRAGLGF